ncbi:E3 ubiquitin-protein ligase RAD18-like isoform X2 [Anguilla rostrata]|uniref:E3 ubiquitin-protein ligase RAD18-like isoform X2 n=1 Tax=Anguilla rostrata TaxID=7938 RepID=UPI0030D425E5
MSVLTEPEFPPHLVSLKNLDSLLRCPICFDYLNISMMTECSHNFCSFCIRKFLSYKLQCPVCNRAMTELDLRNNRILDDLVESFQEARQQLSQTNLEDSSSVSPKTPRPNVKRKAPNASRPVVESTIMKNFLKKGNSPSSSSSSSSLTKRPRLQPPCSNKNLRQDSLKMIRTVKVELVPLPAEMTRTLVKERVAVPSGLTRAVKEKQVKVSAQVSRSVKDRRVEVPEQGARTVKEERVEVPMPLTGPVKKERVEIPGQGARTVKEERVEVPVPLTGPVKKERVEIPEQGTRTVKKEMVAEPATESSSGLTSSPESASTSLSMNAIVKVECPVCSVGILEHHMNSHLDSCLMRGEKKESLRSSAKKRKPLGKLVYNLLSMQVLRERLRDLNLPTQGSRDQLVRRHQEYVLLYNAECDSFTPKSEDIAKEVKANEKMRAQLQRKSKSVMVFSKNQAEEEIDKLHSNYRKQHSVEFSRLIDQVKGHWEATKKACVKEEVPEGGGEAKSGRPSAVQADERSDSAACVLRVSSEDPAEEWLLNAAATERSPSPALSDISVSSSISDVFSIEADRSMACFHL